MAHMECLNGDQAGQKFDLDSDRITVGRDAGCTIQLTDPSVSTYHAEVRYQDGHWLVIDLNSSNGTLVNGSEIQTMQLSTGDLVDFGELQFMFNDAAGAASSPPPASPVAEPSTAPAPSPVAAPTPAKAAPPPEPVFRRRPAHSRPAYPSAEATEEDLDLVRQMKDRTEKIEQEMSKVIVGQYEVLEQVLMCMMAGGHALLVGLPGLAKTLMVRSIGEVLDLNFKRIQFTPDLMPSDITGTEVLETNRDTNEKEFRFIKGPLFCHLLLADEINRTPPKTQAALLEAMQEKMVTFGNVTYELEAPFFVLATQNPIEQEGTYPLPEAQMDRFMFNIWVDYPQEDEEEIIVSTTTVKQTNKIERVLSRDEVLSLQKVVAKIPVSPHVVKYAIRLTRATRPADERATDFIKQYVSVGAGPRAGQYLVLAAKARAVLEGRIHVSCNDIRQAAIPVLRHRLYTNFAADSEGLSPMDLVNRLVEAVEEPSEEDYATV